MSSEVTLPALGESVTEGTISRWLKAVGDTVEADEPLLEVSTDKVDTEIPSPVAGTLLEIKFEEDDVAQVGDVLAIVGEAGEDAGDADEDEPEPEPEEETAEETPVEEAPAEETPEEAPAEKPSASSGSSDATEVTLPALGESVTEGTVSRWLKEVGDSVEADEPLLEVSTDKVDTEIPSPVAGTLLEIRVNEDDVAQVGEVLALVGEASDEPSEQPSAESPTDQSPETLEQESKEVAEDPAPAEEQQDEAAEEDEPAKEEVKAEAPKGSKQPKQEESAKDSAKHSEKVDAAVARRAAAAGGDSTYVTPLVRKLAQEHGVDLGSLEGTGVGGRIRKQDVLTAAEEAKKKPAEKPAAEKGSPKGEDTSQPLPDEASKVRGKTEKLSRMRKVIAKRMKESLDTSAQLTATVEVDLTAVSHIRNQVKDEFKKREGASLSYLPFIVKATVEALKAYPVVNATIDTDEGTVTYADGEHIGIAVDTERGLMVPVVKDAGDLNLTGLAKKIGDVAARTRDAKVGPDELSGGTFTITNYGSAGTLFDTPIINQPEVAILGTGALVKRPVVVTDKFGGETIAVRHMMYLSLSYDHRLIDGADAARFLVAVKDRLEDGDFGGELGL